MQTTGTSLSVCGFCGAPLLDSVTECSTCGKTHLPAASASEWHAYTPKTHFALLWILSFGLYLFPWTYRTWKFLRTEMREDVNPVWRTVLIVVPIVGQVLMFRLFKDVTWFTTRSDGPAFATVMFVWGMFAAGGLAEQAIGDTWSLPFYLVAGGGVWTVQRRINDYYAMHAAIVRASMPVHGWIICGLGAVLWVATALVAIGLL